MAEQVRNLRQCNWFWIDNEIVDNKAAEIGAVPFLVYCYLCRYSYSGTGSISLRTMALDLKLSSRTIARALDFLETARLVSKEGNRGNGKANLYTILSLTPLPNEELNDTDESSKRKKNRPGFVYVISDGSGLHKIGQTENIDQRMVGFRAQIGHGVELVISIPVDDMGTVERYLHTRFIDARDHGEWFRLSTADLQWIKDRATRKFRANGVGQGCQSGLDSHDQAPLTPVTKPIRKQEIRDIRQQPSSPDGDGMTLHGRIRKAIQVTHEKVFQRRCPWGPAEGKILNDLLERHPDWGEKQWRAIIRNRFNSEGIAGEDPRKWLRYADRYLDGALDRYGKVQVQDLDSGDTQESKKPLSGLAALRAQRNEGKNANS